MLPLQPPLLPIVRLFWLMQPDEKFDSNGLSGTSLEAFRHHAQMGFQDSDGSFNPRLTVRDIIAEPLEAMQLTQNRNETDLRVHEIATRFRQEL